MNEPGFREREARRWRLRIAGAVIGVLGLIALWEGARATWGEPFVSVSDAAEFGTGLYRSDRFWQAALSSAQSVGLATVTGTGLGYPIGLVLGMSGAFGQGTRAIVEGARAVPVVAALPYFLCLFGVNPGTVWKLASVPVFLIVTASVSQEVGGLALTRWRQLSQLGVSRMEYAVHCLLWETAGAGFMAVRAAFAHAFALTIALEYILGGGAPGLGALLQKAYWNMSWEQLPALCGAIAIGAWLPISLFGALERRVRRWQTHE